MNEEECNCVCHQYGAKIKEGYCCECELGDLINKDTTKE